MPRRAASVLVAPPVPAPEARAGGRAPASLASLVLAAGLSTVAPAAAQAGDDGLVTPLPLAQRTGGEGLRFVQREAAETGLDFVHQWRPETAYLHVLGNAMAGGGVAVGDADGDGLPEVVLTRPAGGTRLYRWNRQNSTWR